MATDHILSLLHEERDKLNRAIAALAETVHRDSPRTRQAAPKKHRGMSAAKRKALSKRMKAYWAARRKTKS